MNERIQQLHNEAVLYVNSLFDSGTHVPGSKFEMAINEKFAELIVQECAGIATNRYQRLMDGGKAIK